MPRPARQDEDIVKGYEVGKGRYVEITDDELEAAAIGSTHTIEIDKFAPRDEIDQLYWNVPYYIAPDGEIGQQAFAVIREAVKKEGMVALGNIVFTTREHVIAIGPRGKGMLGITLCYPYEIRSEADSFNDIPMKKSPRTCSIWRPISSRPRPGISRQRNSRITTKMLSRS